MNLTPNPSSRKRAWGRRSLIIFGAWSVPALLFTGARIIEARFNKTEISYGQAFLQSSFLWYLWALATPFTVWMARRVPPSETRWLRALALHGSAVVAITLTYIPVSLFIVVRLLAPAAQEQRSLGELFLQFLIFMLPLNAIVYSALIGVVASRDASRKLRERTLYSSRVEAQLARARLHALQAQLHPHFLFNTLNSIAALVRKHDNDRAVRMIARLSDLLRRMLRANENTQITLEQELQFLEDYLAIEQERFGDRLTVEVSVDPTLYSARVPTLILQPLAENAIKHGITPVSDPCTLRISGRRKGDELWLRLENDGRGFHADRLDSAAGIGLVNTRERLTQLYGDRFRLGIEPEAAGRTRVDLVIPWQREEGGGPS